LTSSQSRSTPAATARRGAGAPPSLLAARALLSVTLPARAAAATSTASQFAASVGESNWCLVDVCSPLFRQLQQQQQQHLFTAVLTLGDIKQR